jgi:hypothetical protein
LRAPRASGLSRRRILCLTAHADNILIKAATRLSRPPGAFFAFTLDLHNSRTAKPRGRKHQPTLKGKIRVVKGKFPGFRHNFRPKTGNFRLFFPVLQERWCQAPPPQASSPSQAAALPTHAPGGANSLLPVIANGRGKKPAAACLFPPTSRRIAPVHAPGGAMRGLALFFEPWYYFTNS